MGPKGILRGRNLESCAAALLSLACAACAAPLWENTPTATAPNQQLCSEQLGQDYRSIAFILNARSDRPVSGLALVPDRPGTYPLIGFSHGAFAAPDRYLAMLGPLAGSGFVIVSPMHIDSEEMVPRQQPDEETLWRTRNEDLSLALTPPQELTDQLAGIGIAIDEVRKIAMGHSFGAVMAQFAGGAEPLGDPTSIGVAANPQIDAIVAWSPPKNLPGRTDDSSWTKLAVPSLTITGTTDLLPGFVDDWTLRKAAYENAPQGTAELWVGSDIDHYFGGAFGREKPVDANSQNLFDRAMIQSLNFIQRTGPSGEPCNIGTMIDGEFYETR